MIESFCYSELGLKPKEFYALTLRQFHLMNSGYKRKLDKERNDLIESWRQARLIAYFSVKVHLKDQSIPIYDFYPLPNDPTTEQVIELKKVEQENDGKWMKSVIDNFRMHKVK